MLLFWGGVVDVPGWTYCILYGGFEKWAYQYVEYLTQSGYYSPYKEALMTEYYQMTSKSQEFLFETPLSTLLWLIDKPHINVKNVLVILLISF